MLEPVYQRPLEGDGRARDLLESALDTVDEEEVLLVRQQMDAACPARHRVVEDLGHEKGHLARIGHGKHVEVDSRSATLRRSRSRHLLDDGGRGSNGSFRHRFEHGSHGHGGGLFADLLEEVGRSHRRGRLGSGSGNHGRRVGHICSGGFGTVVLVESGGE